MAQKKEKYLIVEYVEKKNQFYFRIKSRNGKIICHSEYYNNVIDCADAVCLLKDTPFKSNNKVKKST